VTVFFEGLSEHGDRAAVIDTVGRRMTYAQLAHAADRFSRQLGPPQSVVAIEAGNTIETVIAYVASLRAGRVAMMVSATLSDEARQSLYDRFSVSTVVSGVSGAEGPIAHRRGGQAIGRDGLALLLSTSGSTGSPKFVRISAASVDANARAIASYLRLDPDERPVVALPLHYSYGLSILNSHLAVGASVVLTAEPVTSRAFRALVESIGATSLSGVPATWDILRQLRFAGMRLPSIRYCTQAGGRLAMDTALYFSKWARDSGQRFYVMYGQTEATARMSFVPPERLEEKLGSIGIPIPGGAFTLVGPTGEPIVGERQTGEIEYRGPNVMWGYAEGADDLMLDDEHRGVLRTGDLAERDSDGYYYIVGRIKRFAKVMGLRINLDEVEGILLRHGIVGAVTQREERLMIAVENTDPDGALRLVSAELQIHPSGARVTRVDAIPRNASGKVLYPQVDQLFDEVDSRPVARDTTSL
jgi:long-chain acyl-CoA synthetase